MVFGLFPCNPSVSMASEAGSNDSVGQASTSAEKSNLDQLTFENEDLIATATETTAGALPEGSSLVVREITPTSNSVQRDLRQTGGQDQAAQSDIDSYVDVMNKVSDHAQASGKSVVSARAFDIQILDAYGNEIEPQGNVNVSMSYKKKMSLDSAAADTSNVEVAHVMDNGQVEPVAAQIGSDGSGKIESTDFQASSFSVYVIFDTNQTSTTEPMDIGQYGWVRFGGDAQKADALPTTPGFDNAGWMRYLKINIFTLNQGGNPSDFNSYTYQTSFQHLSTWAENFTIEASQLGGTVTMTGYRLAHEQAFQLYSGLEASYPANVYYKNWSAEGFDGDENELNIYLDTNSETPIPQTSQGTRYIIHYYHSDGTYDQEDAVLTQGQSFAFDQASKARSDEAYSGVSVTTGARAVSVDESNGTGTINYTDGTRLVKVNVYYKAQVARKTGGTVDGIPQYDAKVENGTKIYDTSRSGLHTDKTAAVSQKYGSDGRTFDLTLESWNIGTNMANVGVIFDASGSMVWASNTPEAITKSQAEWNQLIGSYAPYTVLTDAQVAKILDTEGTDNSKLNYNGYEYYLYDRVAGVNEFVPMGYSDGTVQDSSFVMNGLPMATAINNGGAGWYYVNSGGYSNYATMEPYTAKQYIGVGPYVVGGVTYYPEFNESDSWNEMGSEWHQIQGIDYGTHANYFYIDDSGNLKACYFYSRAFRISQVYQKADDASTKSEVLQNSVGKFASTLNALSPESQVSMVRFSRNDFSSDQLALLNWTNDTGKMTAAMNQSYGDTTNNGGAASAILDGMTVYNYGFTGATHTYTGIKAFIDDMTYGEEWHQDVDGQWRQYVPKSTNGAASKYLIIFTDGKDNSGNKQQSIDYINALKANGYTVMTVLMESAGMNEQDKAAAKSFLQELASDKPNGGGKYFYSARYDNGDDLARAFQEMAKTIASPHDGYTVTDYIDPRFDLLDADGTVLTTLNEDGAFAEHPVKMSDGKIATLKYDSAKKMFYLEWTDQEIPTTTQGAQGDNGVSVWSSTITVRAKDDFIGGNDILTNGNEPGLNRVYDPDDSSNPQKDFPQTTANPQVLGLTMSNYEDTIFKGEDIDPSNLYEKIAGTASNNLYLDYLDRIGAKDNTDYLATLKSGQAVTVPYYYLPEPGDATSYAGGTSHQNDKVGTLTYKWVADDAGGNTSSPYQTYTTITTNDVHYHLEVTYQPDAVDYGANDSYVDNGTPRTLALTGQDGVDKLIRDPVGTEQTSTVAASGVAVIHDVDGRIKVEKKVNKDKLLDYLNHMESGEVTALNLELQRSYNGQTEGSRSIQIKLTKDSSDASTITYAKVQAMTPDANGDVVIASQWETGLPIGDYTLKETIEGSGFGTPSYQAVARQSISDDPATTDYVESPEFAAAFDQGNDSVVWHVGQVSNGVPGTCSYGNSDFSYAVVTDNVKQVDPALSANGGKNYLNAQIGLAQVINEPLSNLDLLKRAAEDHSHMLSDVQFKLYQSDANWTEPNLLSTPLRTVTTDSAGKVTFRALPDGYYLMYETRAATGYQAPSEPWRIQVSDGRVVLVSGPSNYQTSLQTENGVYPIDNTKAGELPSTGGFGTWLFYLAAIALLTGLALSLRRKRKRPGGGEV